MMDRVTTSTVFGRIVRGVKLLLPDRALKFFPPDFTLRRPAVSLLDKRLRGKASCYLALFRLDFANLADEVPEEAWAEYRSGARGYLPGSVSEHLSRDRLIVLDQFGRSDYVVLVQWNSRVDGAESGEIPAALKDKLDRIRDGLEAELHLAVPGWRQSLRVSGTYIPIASSREGKPADQALREAYELALAIATSQTTPQTEAARKQLVQLLERGLVSVLAQPIMNLTSGDVFGWEILTRGPEGSGLHMPDDLFRLASRTGLLSRLEFLVVGKALEEAAGRRIREPVFLNVTAVTLTHPLFLPHVLACLGRHPMLSPGQIYFEITERHEVPDLEAMADILASYRRCGFRFAVDDAGAGYSSLQWIGELAPELIKIDRSVIRHVDSASVKMSVLKALVTIAEEIQCEVVAEGVEREEEADVLFRLNVGMGQGYYFARPNVLLEEHEREAFQETKERIQLRRRQAAS